MKKLFYTIGIVSSVLFSACSSSFLEGEYSEYVQGDDMGADAATAILSGGYLNMYNPVDNRSSHDDGGYRAFLLAMDFMADDMAMADRGFYIFDYEIGFKSAAYRRTGATWGQFYSSVKSANSVLESMVKIEHPNAVEEHLMGEAYAMRANAYYVLINMYQQPYNVNQKAPGIPIYMHDGNDKLGRNTVKEVYDLIIADLLKSYDLLKGKGASDVTKLNEYAVAGILSRVLCFVNDYPNQWKEVAKYADIAAKGKPLMDESQMLSGMNSVEKIKETLWGAAITSETSLVYASLMSHMDPFQKGYGGSASKAFKEMSTELYSKMDKKDIRFKQFLAKDSLHFYPNAAVATTIPKYTSLKFQDNEQKGFTADLIYMRSAEFYFVKAEALFLDNNEGGARQALTEVMSTRIPGYNTTKTGQDLLDEIRVQKRIELWGEGVRLLDMKWRAESLDRNKSTNHLASCYLKYDANPQEWIYHIPQKEVDANDAITADEQND